MGETRIQLCGRLVVRLDGQRIEDRCPELGQLCSPTSCSTGVRRIGRDGLLEAV